MSVLGETLSHNALAGIALGLVMGINPVLGAVVFALLAVFSIEFVRKAMPRYSDLATTIVQMCIRDRDTTLPVIVKACGVKATLTAVVSGILLSMVVPLLVPLIYGMT